MHNRAEHAGTLNLINLVLNFITFASTQIGMVWDKKKTHLAAKVCYIVVAGTIVSAQMFYTINQQVWGVNNTTWYSAIMFYHYIKMYNSYSRYTINKQCIVIRQITKTLKDHSTKGRTPQNLEI